MTQPSPAASYLRTDLGNTHFFIDLYGEALRYDQSRKQWLIWREHRWEPDIKGRASEAAQLAARKRLQEAINMPSGSNPSDPNDPASVQKENAVKWGLQSEGRIRIENVLALAKNDSRISVNTAYGWDANPWVIGVPNGVVELRTGLLRPGRQEDQITRHAGTKYDASATCPRWESFIEEVLDGDQELITFTRRALGYTLTGDVREDCWFGCYGEGRNGKSTLFSSLHAVLGDYSYVAPFSLVADSGRGETRRDFDIAYLQHMRFVMASETREGGVWDEERLKKLTGGDPIHAEIKHGASFNFYPTHKLWFMFNHQPRVRDHSTGFWRRVRLLPFLRKFEGAADDKTLDKKLEAERVGILTWLVKACLEWQAHGLTTPASVLAASKRYEEDEDPLSEFIEQRIDAVGGGFYLRDAFFLYNQWSKANQLRNPLGRNRFGALLETRGFRRGKKNSLPFFENGKLIYTCTCMKTPCQCLGGP